MTGLLPRNFRLLIIPEIKTFIPMTQRTINKWFNGKVCEKHLFSQVW